MNALRHLAVVGDGTMATALAAGVCSNPKWSCILYSDDPAVVRAINQDHRHPYHFSTFLLPATVMATSSAASALVGAEAVLMAVESTRMRQRAREIAPFLASDVRVLSATKGFERDSDFCMSEIIGAECGVDEPVILSGPNLAYDIVAGLPTLIVLACKNPSVLKRTADMFSSPSLRISLSSDATGVEYAGALKNVVAIAAGIAEGLRLGDNARSAIVAMGLAEIERLGSALGAEQATFWGLAGVGDLFLTATSRSSRNHEVGVQIGEGMKLPGIADQLAKRRETAEGINAVRACRNLGLKAKVAMPIGTAVDRILFGDADPREEFSQLFDSWQHGTRQVEGR